MANATILVPVHDVEKSTARKRSGAVATLLRQRLVLAVFTLFAVSLIIFAATQLLPGNAAYSILGNTATPEKIQALESQMGLDQSAFAQYVGWAGDILTGNPGTSLASGAEIWPYVWPRLVNSAFLALFAGVLGAIVGISLGILTAWRRDRGVDHVVSTGALVVTALPEFVVGIILILLFSTKVFTFLPPVSILPPGTFAWQRPVALVLPVVTLAAIVAPYILRMTRAAVTEALDSDYVEMARLKGLSDRRILIAHAFPNALPPVIQVVGLCLLYLAGGVVVVETVFAFPGIGQGLVASVTARDVPVIQFMVLLLAVFYICVNILTDVVALIASPRRRFPR